MLKSNIMKAIKYLKALLLELIGSDEVGTKFVEHHPGEVDANPSLLMFLDETKYSNYHVLHDKKAVTNLEKHFYLHLCTGEDSNLKEIPCLRSIIFLRMFEKDIDAFNQRYETYLASKESLHSEQIKLQKQYIQEIIQGAFSKMENALPLGKDLSLSDGLSLNDAKNIALTCKAAAEKASDGKQKYQAILQPKLPLLFIDRLKETPKKTTAINLP